MRIASLLPSATEIVCALGLADQLVGVSHECDYPADVVAGVPILTRSRVPAGLSSAEVDATVSDLLRRGESLYLVEEETLAALNPDLLITQELCDVCAVSYDDVCRIAQRLPSQPKVVSLTPPDLNGIFADIATIAAATGVPERGQALIAELHARLDRVAAQVNKHPRPRVFLLEWLDPPFAAGHWAPEMVALAGGQEVLGKAGEKSFRVTWEQVIDAAPEVILIAPCGYSQAAAEREWATLPKPAGWETIPAVQQGRVHALDANSYCSRPAPRVVDGIEQLAVRLHQRGEEQGTINVQQIA
ncbi:MAG: cobalamin-binding protein [Caldilineaceae bacterium]|nr:cobalamin-binding protein [Caldilineaceae bacterium]